MHGYDITHQLLSISKTWDYKGQGGFLHGNIYNSTANDILARHCRNVAIPEISIHGLRHTHLFAGVSIASVARKLGHSNITTTQKTYFHIIQELESKDIDIIMRSISNLNS